MSPIKVDIETATAATAPVVLLLRHIIRTLLLTAPVKLPSMSLPLLLLLLLLLLLRSAVAALISTRPLPQTVQSNGIYATHTAV
jgi:hypothetical protein